MRKYYEALARVFRQAFAESRSVKESAIIERTLCSVAEELSKLNKGFDIELFKRNCR